MAGSIHLIAAGRSGFKTHLLLIVVLLALLAGLAIFAAPTGTAAAEQAQEPTSPLSSGQGVLSRSVPQVHLRPTSTCLS